MRGPRARTPRTLAASLVVAAFTVGWACPGWAQSRPDAPAVDLAGTWYVLIHYRDRSEDPDAELWDDRIWVFERKGSRLQWTEYVDVVFQDERNRFETLPGGRRSRALGHWEPTRKQHDEIKKGVEVSPRGSRVKRLRPVGPQGYRSTGGRSGDSASVVGYSETWEIRDADTMPSFVRSALMSSARAESLEGVTSFQTREVYGGGDVLEGLYERDLVRRGSFEMMRAGEVSVIGGKKLQRRSFE